MKSVDRLSVYEPCIENKQIKDARAMIGYALLWFQTNNARYFHEMVSRAEMWNYPIPQSLHEAQTMKQVLEERYGKV